MAQIEKNQAFIDGQNLVMGTVKSDEPWTIGWFKFRTYLADKYNVSKAYYFAGAYYSEYEGMYNGLMRSGYELVFRPFPYDSTSKKKGNVDTDIVFEIMRKLADREDFDKVVLVSGDGDYYKMVDYLIKKDKFKKLVVPNKAKISSLYAESIPDSLITYLNDEDIKKKLIFDPKKM